ncbi:Zn-dependent exopeptidase M28 [Kribbella sp. ALI-6-A]|uniref:M28 family peptidase n=1 Tax=Kribbella sp. ALI-6-A TaxID=1933817 RepID=UPI00097C5230|nr:M28 family peptidase [Kribbella sp. ALI-6-A]ONI72363.1 Zn-dependent exopeptidase M28 [Kribbella sp. ALI-6-A]
MTERSGLSRRGLLGAVAGATAATALSAATPAWAADDPRPGAVRPPTLDSYDRQLVKSLSSDRALEHLKVLSEQIGPRIGGTVSEKRAADYLAGQLDKFGYRTRLEPFPVADKFTAEIGDLRNVLPNDICWQAGAAPGGKLNVTVQGPARDVGPATAPVWPADVAGAVVLADDTAAVRAAFVAEAASRGAVAVILLPADQTFPRRASAFAPSGLTDAPIPVIGVAQVQKRLLREALAVVTSLPLSISTTAHRGLISNNVIGERRGKGSNPPIVMVSGHYDTVIGAPGANDDGSGTVLTLEVARVLAKLPTEATLRFALWGSEEQGLIGSRYHVAQLAQDQRDRYRAVFQNDMVATSWDPAIVYWLLSFTGLANTATDAVRASGQRLGYDAQMVGPVTRGASDHQSFQEVGIAAANFSWRGESSPALLEPPYHSPEDTIAKNISLERLQVSMELIGTAAYAVARRR